MLNFEARKLTPTSRDNHGEVHHTPDSPLVQRVGLEKVSFFVPSSANLGSLGPVSLREKWANLKGSPTKGFIVTPLSEVPLTAFYRTSHGGRRVGGGGTSVEALSRARKKARRNY